MTTVVTQEQGYSGLVLKIPRVTTQSTLAQVTTAGWWNNNPINGQTPLNPQDLVAICYSYGNASLQATSLFSVSIGANGVVTLSLAEADVVLPTIANHIAVYTNTLGTLSEDAATAINGGNIQAGLSGTAGYLASFPSASLKGSFRFVGVANTGDTLVTLSNALHGQATVYSIPDSGAATANMLISKLTGTQHVTVGSFQVDAGVISSGLATGGQVGSFVAYPTTTTSGSLAFTALVNSSGNFSTTVSNATAVGQNQVISIPDSGSATASFVLNTGTNTAVTATTGTFTNLRYGATPVPQVDPASCTIAAVAGAANTSTITVQLKDGSGTNMARVIPFKVYLATDNTGLVLQSAASTGYSVTSGGVVDPTGSTTITQGIAAFSSATGGCVISLLDTGKGTGNLILMLPNGFKASAAITAGSYG